MSLGNKIYTLRKEKGLSQNELAELLNVSRQAISKWETDTAVPELDKLILICDHFGISLDELTGREEKQTSTGSDPVSNASTAFTTQKIVGYILLAVSLIGLFLSILLTADTDRFYILLLMMLSFVACGLICLFVANRAWYWCIWSLLAPISFLIPRIAILPYISLALIAQIFYGIVVVLSARRVFRSTAVQVTPARSVGLLVLWGAFLMARILLFFYPWGAPNALLSPTVYVFWELFCHAFVAVFVTYTVCYWKNLKKKD